MKRHTTVLFTATKVNFYRNKSPITETTSTLKMDRHPNIRHDTGAPDVRQTS
jgi:hypothetical protein